MGGSALQNIRPGRMHTSEFRLLIFMLRMQLEGDFVEQMEIPRSFPGKPTHGDIDIVVILKPGVKMADIRSKLDSKEWVRNGPISHFEFHGRQVDLVAVPDAAALHFCIVLESYGMFTMALGMLLRRQGLKLTKDGLTTSKRGRARGDAKLLPDFVLSVDIQRIFAFLGLSYAGFWDIKSEQDLYEFIAQSHFYHPDVFAGKVLRPQRKEDQRLVGLVAFAQRQLAAAGEAWRAPAMLNLEAALGVFGKLTEYRALQAESEAEAAFRRIYNGSVVMEALSLRPGPEVGSAVKRLQLEQEPAFLTFARSNPSRLEVLAWVREADLRTK